MGFRLLWRIGSANVLTLAALVFPGPSAGPALNQTKALEAEVQPFVGTWTAVHSGTPIIVLRLRSEKGEIVGSIQVCSYNMNNSGMVDVVTDPTLSTNLPIKNITVVRRSMSFDWTDPDGDNDHWKLELTGENAGQIVWVGLPSQVKVQPIPVTRNSHKAR